jgi:hypothetical protein
MDSLLFRGIALAIWVGISMLRANNTDDKCKRSMQYGKIMISYTFIPKPAASF